MCPLNVCFCIVARGKTSSNAGGGNSAHGWYPKVCPWSISFGTPFTHCLSINASGLRFLSSCANFLVDSALPNLLTFALWYVCTLPDWVSLRSAVRNLLVVPHMHTASAQPRSLLFVGLSGLNHLPHSEPVARALCLSSASAWKHLFFSDDKGPGC